MNKETTKNGDWVLHDVWLAPYEIRWINRHRIVGWTQHYQPVGNWPEDGDNYRFQVECACGEVFATWNSACTSSQAMAHVREHFPMRTLDRLVHGAPHNDSSLPSKKD